MNILKKLNITPFNAGTCAGKESAWFSDEKAEVLNSLNPSNGEVIASVRLPMAEHYDLVIKAAEQAFLSWRTVPAPKRGELIRKIGLKLRSNKDYLGSLIALEMGKSKQEGDGEVQEMIDMADFAVGQSRMLYGRTMHSERIEHRMYEQWQPLGIVGIISAFNFPMAVWAWNAFIAVICGNVVVWKPSSKTPLCAIAIQHLCNQVMKEEGFEGLFSLLTTPDRTLANDFVSDPRVSLISFTGSVFAGRVVAERVARRLGKVILELGGNNAIIIDEFADLNLAIPAIIFGALGTAGQRCTTVRRLIVHYSLIDTVIERLKKAYEMVQIGDPLDPKNLMGPLIDASAQAQFVETVLEAKRAGGEILTGGEVLKRAGFYVQPTLIRAKNEWPVVQRETFAPILYVISYATLSEAINLQNSVPQGLSSAIFTDRLSHAEQFLSSTGSDCGIANVNIGTSGAEIGGAFGGEKDTGSGREAGSDAWKNYMRRQTVTINYGQTLSLAQGVRFDTPQT